VTIEELVARWSDLKGGAERSNLAPFIADLCGALGLPRPGPAAAGTLGAYEFEGKVPGGSFRSLKGPGSIDLYRRGCFILEAKQSQLPAGQQPGLFEPAETAPRAPSGARYDQLMRDARAQAENYARNLLGDHPPVPFLIVLDIGRAFELYFDYAGNGRGYAFFPDKQRYRIALEDLASGEIVARLVALNAERAAEEAAGHIRWLRPDYQVPRFAGERAAAEKPRRRRRAAAPDDAPEAPPHPNSTSAAVIWVPAETVSTSTWSPSVIRKCVASSRVKVVASE
jgi:hypothetical protein